MAETQILSAKDLSIGTPLEWDVFDQKGRLLLRKGMALQSDRQVSKVLSYGAHRLVEISEEVDVAAESEKNDVLSPFDNIEKTVNEIARVYLTILKNVASTTARIQAQIYELSRHLIELCEYDIDATLGALHLGKRYQYTVLHPVNTAILSNILAEKLEYDVTKRTSIISAALTANIGMFELQQSLVKQKEQLTEKQKEKINKHPVNSAVLLKHWGVTDRLWLEVVLQHHEQKDGSGYPRRLSAEKFIQEARIVGIADRYHALLSPRGYRRGLLPTEALSRLFKERGKEVDEELTLMFVREVGIYPPGSIVRLKNGETAIVTRRGEDRMKPMVKSIANDKGVLLPVPVQRDTGDKLQEITGMCQAIPEYKANLKVLWDYEL